MSHAHTTLELPVQRFVVHVIVCLSVCQSACVTTHSLCSDQPHGCMHEFGRHIFGEVKMEHATLPAQLRAALYAYVSLASNTECSTGMSGPAHYHTTHAARLHMSVMAC